MSYLNICIVTQSHLCRNPRVLKEAIALSNAGYNVTVINSTYSRDLYDQDIRLISNTTIKLIAVASLEKKVLTSFIYRLAKRIGDNLVKNINVQTPMALGYASWRYKSIALKQNADLYVCHQELGLYCGVQLIKAKKRVAFDFEDWYSEDLLPRARKQRPVKLLRSIEQYALQNGAFSITTSNAMANALSLAYKSKPVATIYNTFDVSGSLPVKPKLFTSPLKLFWFSQTIGEGRGLEQFFQLINKMEQGLEINLLGAINETYKIKLQQLLNQKHQLFFHPLVDAEKLAEKIAEFDIGLALELDHPLSRRLTVTNKLFQYISSGLIVIATNTDGQKEIIDKFGGGILIDYNQMENAAKDLQALFNNPVKLQTFQKEVDLAKKELNWQQEKIKLLGLIKQSINND